jgi:hypothetical protein
MANPGCIVEKKERKNPGGRVGDRCERCKSFVILRQKPVVSVFLMWIFWLGFGSLMFVCFEQ